jgi:hypothetical protein
VSRTLAFEFHLLLLVVFEVEVLEILWQLALYSMIDRLETSERTKIKKIEQQTVDYQ